MKRIKQLQKQIKQLDEAIQEVEQEEIEPGSPHKVARLAVLTYVKKDYEKQLEDLRAWN